MKKMVAVSEVLKWITDLESLPLFPVVIKDQKVTKPHDISMFAGHPLLTEESFAAIVGPLRGCSDLTEQAFISLDYSHTTIATIHWANVEEPFKGDEYQQILDQIQLNPFQLKPAKVVMNSAGEIRLLWKPVGENTGEIYRIRAGLRQRGLSQFDAPSIHTSLSYPTSPPNGCPVPKRVQLILEEINVRLAHLPPVTLSQIGIRKAVFPDQLTPSFFQNFRETDRVAIRSPRELS